MYILSLSISSLSALILICLADSSPVTYSTFSPWPATLSPVCINRVDLPIPGSPPTNTKELLTIPPPKTLSSSMYFVVILFSSFTSISFNLRTLLELIPLEFFLVSLFIISSVNVFQLLHPGHLPIHLGDS